MCLNLFVMQGSICTLLCDAASAAATLELTAITPEELTQRISVAEHDPLLVLFYVRWATTVTEAMRTAIHEASTLFGAQSSISVSVASLSHFGRHS